MTRAIVSLLASALVACATPVPVPACGADAFTQVNDPPYSCRGGSQVAEYLERTVYPHRNDVQDRGRGNGTIKVRASFGSDGSLHSYCLETTGTTEKAGQDVAQRIRSSLVNRGPAPACLAGTRLLLLDAELEKGPGVYRRGSTQQTLHRGHRDYMSRAQEQCMAEHAAASGSPTTSTQMASFICSLRAQSQLLTAKASPTGELLFFAPKDLRGTPTDADRVLALCASASVRADLVACIETHGWQYLNPDPAPF
jgi:hypothetical protein